MKNLFKSGKTSSINKNNITHKINTEPNHSSLDEEKIENLKESEVEDIIPSKKILTI